MRNSSVAGESLMNKRGFKREWFFMVFRLFLKVLFVSFTKFGAIILVQFQWNIATRFVQFVVQ